MKRPSHLLLLTLIVALTASACGISFSDDFDGTELFAGIELIGDRTVGGELTVRLHITNGYPVPVRVACFYEEPDAVTADQEKLSFQERATLVGDVVLPAQPDRTPGFGGDKAAAEAARETLTFPFRVSAPGRYIVACLTPAASDNGLSVNFTVR